METKRLLELAGMEVLTEGAKSLEGAMKYFEESGSDDKFTFYDIKGDFIAHHKDHNIIVIDISKDKKEFHVHSEEAGEMKATESAIANLEIFKLQKVY